MIFGDSCHFIALVQTSDALHQRAVRWAKTVKEPVLVTEYVLWEVVNGLSDPADRRSAHAAANHILTTRGYVFVPASSELLTAGLQLHAARPDKEWSLTDCISFHVMTTRGIRRALTHDHHFEQAGFEALLRRDPP
jgi:predicted nucleic acid-binding protein